MAPPPATKASMSACLILPAGPLPFNDERSIPDSLALLLTAGLASTVLELETGISGAALSVGIEI